MIKFQTKFSKLVFRAKFEQSIKAFLKKHTDNHYKQKVKRR